MRTRPQPAGRWSHLETRPLSNEGVVSQKFPTPSVAIASHSSLFLPLFLSVSPKRREASLQNDCEHIEMEISFPVRVTSKYVSLYSGWDRWREAILDTVFRRASGDFLEFRGHPVWTTRPWNPFLTLPSPVPSRDSPILPIRRLAVRSVLHVSKETPEFSDRLNGMKKLHVVQNNVMLAFQR